MRQRPANSVIFSEAIRTGHRNCRQTIAASSGEPYVEAHHLVPMGVSDQYPEASLDVGPNIFALCPNCHRAIHYGEDDRKRESLQQLFEIDEKSIADAGIQISLVQLLKLYGVEEGEAQ